VLLVGHGPFQIKNPAQWPGLEMKKAQSRETGP
jgi:hypothetical protein